MKKRIAVIISALALVAVMLIGLCGCGSSWSGIKSAYEKAGYEETEVADAQKELVTKALGDDAENAVTIHVMKKGLLEIAVIVEFKSTQKMEELLKDKVSKEDAENIYEELQKLDTVNGTCFWCGPAGLDIFKSTK